MLWLAFKKIQICMPMISFLNCLFWYKMQEFWLKCREMCWCCILNLDHSKSKTIFILHLRFFSGTCLKYNGDFFYIIFFYLENQINSDKYVYKIIRIKSVHAYSVYLVHVYLCTLARAYKRQRIFLLSKHKTRTRKSILSVEMSDLLHAFLTLLPFFYINDRNIVCDSFVCVCVYVYEVVVVLLCKWYRKYTKSYAQPPKSPLNR